MKLLHLVIGHQAKYKCLRKTAHTILSELDRLKGNLNVNIFECVMWVNYNAICKYDSKVIQPCVHFLN